MYSSFHQGRSFQVFRCQLPKKNPFCDDKNWESECTEDDLTVQSDHACLVNSEQDSAIDLHEEVNNVGDATIAVLFAVSETSVGLGTAVIIYSSHASCHAATSIYSTEQDF